MYVAVCDICGKREEGINMSFIELRKGDSENRKEKVSWPIFKMDVCERCLVTIEEMKQEIIDKDFFKED